MLLFALALALAQAAPFDTSADYGALARGHCAREWPDDFQMQSYCYRQQHVGMLQFKAISDDLGKTIEKALEQCAEAWTRGGLPDWQMIGHCAVEQGTAYRRINESIYP